MSDISNDLSTGSCTPAKEVEQSYTETNANIFRDKNVMNPQDAHDLLSKTLADRHSSKGQKLSIISSLRRFSNRNSSTLKQAPGECSKSFGKNYWKKWGKLINFAKSYWKFSKRLIENDYWKNTVGLFKRGLLKQVLFRKARRLFRKSLRPLG